VALKLVKRGMDSKEVLARFESERQALALMSHPGIAKVFDAGTSDDGPPYFVMEHVAGVPITEYCDRNRLSARQRLELFVEVCEAVQHAHTKGIIHRDIKPSNVLVSVQDSKPQPKVIDFGVAKAVSQRLTEKTLFTQLGVMIGTPGYMSPEQAEVTGLDVDTRSDIYSLGVLAYELLVGELPFDARRLRQAAWRELQRIIQEEEPPRPSARLTTLGATATDAAAKRGTDPLTLARELRGDLDWITLKALEKDRTRRYQSASELAADVRRHFRDEPVQAGPPRALYRLGKAVKRHRLLFGAGAAVATALVVGLVAATAQYLRAEAARREARRQVVRLHVAKGMELVDSGNAMAGLLWLVAALRLEEDQARQVAHRLRIGTTLDRLPALNQLWAHDAGVNDAVFSPDGSAIASASQDKTARVWSLRTGEAVGPPLRHDGPVWSVAFSPDGASLLTGSEDGTARLWDVSTGRRLAEFRHKGPVTSVACRQQGDLVATSSEDDTAKVWELKSGQAIAILTHAGDVNTVEFSRDGRFLATASADGTAKVWETQLRRLLATLRHPNARVNAASFSPDGERVVTTGEMGATHVWSTRTGNAILPPLQHRSLDSWVARFSPRGEVLAVGTNDRTLHLWSAKTATALAPPIELNAVPLALGFSPDGQLLATADSAGHVRLWRVATGEAVGASLSHLGSTVASFDPTGRLLLTAGEDGTVRVWDLATMAPAGPHFQGHSGFTRDGTRILTLRFEPEPFLRAWDSTSGDPVTPRVPRPYGAGHDAPPDARFFATARSDCVRVWNLSSGEPVGASAPIASELLVDEPRVAISPDGGTLAVTSHDADSPRSEQVYLWDVSSGTRRATVLRHGGRVRGVAFSRDGRWIVTGSDDQTLRVWDARTGSPYGQPLPYGVSVVPSAMSPDGTRVGAVGEDGSLSVRSLPEGHLEFTLKRELGLFRVAFSPDGRRLATSGVAAQVWDASTGERVGAPIPASGTVWVLRFSPDGRWLIVGGEGNAARVWDPETGQPVTPSYLQDHVVGDAGFSPDGNRVILDRAYPFRPDPRPLEDLEHLVELLNGRRLASADAASPIAANDLRREWLALTRRYPQPFGASPTQVQAWHRERALALSSDGAWEDAVAHWDQAVALGPLRWRLLFNRGRALAELGRWDDAARDHGAALGLFPGELEPAYALTLLHAIRGDRARVEDVRRGLLERWSGTQNPDRARWAALSMVLAPVDQSAARAKALGWAKVALDTYPHDPERVTLYGAALLRAGRVAEAVAVLEDARMGPKADAPVAAAVFLALAARARGQGVSGARWCREAQEALRRLDRAHSVLSDAESTHAQGGPVAWQQRAQLRVLIVEARCPSAPEHRTFATSR
jgi:WD40 repeat protein/Flp pilus assembly protein TadD